MAVQLASAVCHNDSCGAVGGVMATKHRLGDQSRDCSWLCSPSRIAFLDRTSPIPLNPLRSQRVTEHQTLPYVYFIFPLCLSRGRVEETQCLFGNLSLRGRTVGEAKKIDKSPPLVLEPPWWQVRWRLVPAVFFVLVGIYFFAYYILFLAHSITPPWKVPHGSASIRVYQFLSCWELLLASGCWITSGICCFFRRWWLAVIGIVVAIAMFRFAAYHTHIYSEGRMEEWVNTVPPETHSSPRNR